MTLQPGFVKTKFIKESDYKGSVTGLVSLEDCVSAALRDLGHESWTYGPLVHEIHGNILTAVT